MGIQSRNNARAKLRQRVSQQGFSFIDHIVSQEKGEQNEQKAFTLLREIIKRPPYLDLDLTVTRTEAFSPDDLDGIDIRIETPWGVGAIQIKSSMGYKIKFEEEHPDIPCAVVHDHLDHDTVLENLTRVLDQSLNFLSFYSSEESNRS